MNNKNLFVALVFYGSCMDLSSRYIIYAIYVKMAFWKYIKASLIFLK